MRFQYFSDLTPSDLSRYSELIKRYRACNTAEEVNRAQEELMAQAEEEYQAQREKSAWLQTSPKSLDGG